MVNLSVLFFFFLLHKDMPLQLECPERIVCMYASQVCVCFVCVCDCLLELHVDYYGYGGTCGWLALCIVPLSLSCH